MNNMNFIDKIVNAVDPVRGAKRAAARQAIKVLNSGYGNYGANLTKKSLRGWNYAGGSEKEDIEDNIDVLRQRSRDAFMGVPIATAALKTLRTNVVCIGLLPQPSINSAYLNLSPEQTEELQNKIKTEFSLWADSKTCDATRMENFYELQQLAFLSFLMSGDVIALLPTGKQQGQPYDLRVRLVEADRVSSPQLHDWLLPCTIDGHKVYRIVQGVETDENGMVVAYWVCNRHPLSDIAEYRPEGMKWTRVEAYGTRTGRPNVLHIMTRERPDQLRGVPMLAPVIESLKQLGRYTDSEITAAVLSAMFTVFVKSETASDARPFGEMLPPDQQVDAQDQSSIELGPGAIAALGPGEDVTFADPKHPNTGYEQFTDALVRQIGAALEIPIEVIYKQFSTSYSAARGALNEFWRTCTMYREWLSTKFCQPIYEEWFAEAVAKGRIKAPGFFTDPAIRKAYTICNWNGPARTNLNPVQEASAAAKRVANGFSTAQEETAQMTGGDYYANIRQRKIEAARKKEVDDIINPPELKQTEGNNA